MRRIASLGVALALVVLASVLDARQATATRRYVVAAGRRLPYVYAVSLEAALDPANNGTSKAIVSRSKVAADALDGRLLGDPANLVVSDDGRTVYVVNHHGAIDNAEFRQHGGRGQIAVLDVDDLVSPVNDRTATALRRHMDSGGFGALGLVLQPEALVVANAENHLTEDGGNRITVIDRRTGSLRGVVELALGTPGFPCDYPVPYVVPVGPPRNLAVRAPDKSWGCFPDPNGLALGRSANGRAYLFSANGGTNDVSVIDLARALRGDVGAEIGRIPVQVGPWGITATPDGRHVIVANGGSQREASAGNTLSVIDVDRAAAGEGARAELARVLVGTDDPTVQTHPLMPVVTPDGREVIVPNVRADNVSIVRLDQALAGRSTAEVERIALVRVDGQPARPRGSAVTRDGRYVVVSGGPASPPFSQETGHLYVIDVQARRVVATVTGVGHEPYAVAIVERP